MFKNIGFKCVYETQINFTIYQFFQLILHISQIEVAKIVARFKGDIDITFSSVIFSRKRAIDPSLSYLFKFSNTSN